MKKRFCILDSKDSEVGLDYINAIAKTSFQNFSNEASVSRNGLWSPYKEDRYNWVNIVGWAIAYQEESAELNSWYSVVNTMISTASSSFVQMKENKISLDCGQYSFDKTSIMFEQMTLEKLKNSLSFYKPYIDFINELISLGYTPLAVS